jgi:hypothetical protein
VQIVVETGLIGRQANGAVTVTDGETVNNRERTPKNPNRKSLGLFAIDSFDEGYLLPHLVGMMIQIKRWVVLRVG